MSAPGETSKDQWVSPQFYADYTDRAVTTIHQERQEGKGPPYWQSCPNGAVRYRLADIDKWMRKRIVQPHANRVGA